ncbi:MAG: YebC/PmpR family DNA-binding transcriptional regulator [Clostridia bacterium]|nr:YebC/PmpR family DNA-binding transcriptional regulator [Clostridia bacterium]MDD4686072.1 YebC/PmpR family DNA-binding transcriptional regulator [Clostridia bacterium]
MSGHSKWHNIQARKKKGDAARGKVFTKIGRELAVAVKEGGADPDTNNRLRDIITKAKQNNMPSDNIARAIKKASGDINSVRYENITYEGYGVAGSAVIVECLTDNKNRTAGDVRHCFDKYGGGLGATGCVSYLFKRKGVIIVEKDDKINSDDIFIEALEAGAEDIQEDDEVIEIYTTPESLKEVADNLEKANIVLASQDVDQIPDMYIELEENKKSTFEKMLEALEDLDDVQEVYHNVKLD